jgi:hypothetical protein
MTRGFRLLDSYLPLGGAHDREPAIEAGLVDVPASRFLRSVRAGPGERLRLQRILTAMRKAARRRTVFHLWWHPHNFGADLAGNLASLLEILDHFRALNERYGMRSMTMADVADEIFDGHDRAADH